MQKNIQQNWLVLPHEKTDNPLGACANIAHNMGWTSRMEATHFLKMKASGRWCNYRISVECLSQKECLMLTCRLVRVPRERHDDVFHLLARLNQMLWTGHVSFSTEDNYVMYRDTLLYGAKLDEHACHLFLQQAQGNCERAFPALQMVLWGHSPVEEAVAWGLWEAWEEV